MLFKVLIIFGVVSAGLTFSLPQNNIADDDFQEVQRYSSRIIDPGSQFLIRGEDLDDIFEPREEEGLPEDVIRARRSPQDGRRGSASVTVNNESRRGTDVRADLNARLWEGNNRRSSLDANAYYQRHFGGPMGTGRPDAGVGLNFRHRF